MLLQRTTLNWMKGAVLPKKSMLDLGSNIMDLAGATFKRKYFNAP